MLMSASPGRGGAKVRSARAQRGTGSSIATAQQHQWRVGRRPVVLAEIQRRTDQWNRLQPPHAI